MVGLFINSVPVRIRIDQNTTARAALKALQARTARSNAYDYCPLSKIQKQSYLGNDLLQTVLAFENYSSGEKRTIPDDLLRPVCIREEIFTDLSPYAYLEDGKLILHVKFDTGLYRKAEIERVLNLFKHYVEGISSKPEGRLSAFGCLDRDEQEKVIRLSQGDTLPYDTGKTWLDHFRMNVIKDPTRKAVTDSRGSLTYSELDKASDAVASYLIAEGVAENSFVAVKMGRVKEFVAVIIGIQKAGAAYVPVDPDYPEDRIKYMLEDSETKVVLTEALTERVLAEYRDAEPVNRATPDHRAYMIYTSGSTGKPKGVIQSHRSLCAFCTWRQMALGIGFDSVHAAHPSFSFDASLDDLICPLFAGGEVHVFSDELRKDMAGMAAYIRERHINALTMSTQMGMAMVNQYPDLELRYIMMGGEKMLPCAKTKIRLINGYGPTEFTVCSSYHVVNQDKDVDIPIGRPVPNTWSFICNEYGNLLPQGMAGELCLAGAQIAEGYWKQKALTDEKFVPCPFLDGQDAKMYRTGDLARYNEAGELEFLGRIGAQVKLRGFRIEPGEVENTAGRYEGIAQVAAVVHRRQLVLYFTADRRIDQKYLRTFLSGSLAEYMVPTAYMQLDEMPMTPNGKIDRRKLPDPVRQGGYEEPATPMERELCEQYAKILGLEKVGALDSFFEIGGDSISASNLLTFAMGKGYPLVYKDIFKNPTPRQLAAVITGTVRSEYSRQAADYDYSRIDSLIAQNTMEHLDEISAEPVGNVILTGAKGFLGIHVLHQFLETSKGKIFCLMRKVQWDTLENHLKSLLMYYFGNTYEALFGERIFCLDGDITDKQSLLGIDTVKADMVINCAANVKHFVKDDSLDRINFHGVENLIEVCLKNRLRLVQVSTLSVGGGAQAGQKDRLYENDLYFGQNLDNDYIRTKFLAERAILEARVERGLDAVILRAGNLMGRYSDGEFQINLLTNAFMRSLAAFHRLGARPVTALAVTVELSPIDSTAVAMLTLAGVNSRISVFNVNNNHSVTMGDIIFALNRHGLKIAIVTEKEFAGIMQAASENGSYSGSIMSMTAYDAREGENLVPVESDNYFTVNALYRLGFKWPIVDDAYLERIISAVDTLEFFKNL